MKIGIKIKLAVILSTLLFAATVSIGAILILQHKSDLEEQLRSMAGTITHEFANGSKMPFMQKDTLGMTLAVQNILKYPGILDAYILNHRFEVEAHKDVLEAGGDFALFDTGLIMARHGEEAPWTIDHGDEKSITFASPIVFRDTTVGYTVVSFSKGFIREQVRRAVTRVTIIGFMVAGAVTLFSIPLASGLLRPVLRLFQGTREIALGNFDYRIPEVRKDEIGDLVASFNRMASDLKKKEILRGVLNRYVSRHVADEIFRDPERVRLGGHRREVTVFFADIRGFTSMSRKMEPEEIVELLNRYFTVVTDMVFRFEGTIDKFIGDAVMSVFGSPIRSLSHLEQGVKAAMAVKLAVERMNSLRAERGETALEMGIGLDAGEVIVGNMGSSVRMEYTAVGDPVNTASRLTDLARGGEILVSEFIYSRVAADVVAEEMRGVYLKGFDKPVTLYNIKELGPRWAGEVEGVVSLACRELREEGFVI
ncbi:MAG: HAMP domain-containing protein [Candidatus Methylomirabilis sp.]|nr:HAMP domain-containing protein [Deltaproteobacteria bacterium]